MNQSMHCPSGRRSSSQRFGAVECGSGTWRHRGVGDAMVSVGECRRIVARGRDGLWRAYCALPSWRESLATLVIGSLSTGLGIAALSAVTIQDPRLDPVYAACAGQWLGFGGILLAQRINRGPSPLSLIGT